MVTSIALLGFRLGHLLSLLYYTWFYVHGRYSHDKFLRAFASSDVTFCSCHRFVAKETEILL